MMKVKKTSSPGRVTVGNVTLVGKVAVNSARNYLEKNYPELAAEMVKAEEELARINAKAAKDKSSRRKK